MAHLGSFSKQKNSMKSEVMPGGDILLLKFFISLQRSNGTSGLGKYIHWSVVTRSRSSVMNRHTWLR